MKYITIEKNKDNKGAIIVDSSSCVYTVPSIIFGVFVESEIKKFDMDNKKARKKKLKTDLSGIKQLVEEGYCVHAVGGDFQYSISFKNPDGDKRPSVSFTTSKDNGMAILFDKAEEWAEAVIDDYGVQL